MKNSKIYYSVGALLYCPANNERIVSSLIKEKFGRHFSLALCLEDTIRDDRVKEAEEILVNTINTLFCERARRDFFIPKIFIRVRNHGQILNLFERFGESRSLITGFILPKFSLENADPYIDAVSSIRKYTDKNIYMMPIMENPAIIPLKNRPNLLYLLKEKLDEAEDLVLNIRVGGNDLCHMFGFRRNSNESIHNIRPISNIFADIITVFGMDYVISGPVFEYYSGDNWENGFRQELQEDRLCGFTGKTVIHPNQIEAVNNTYKVSQKDFEDAKSILNWNPACPSLVSGSIARERMNECKTHSNWAIRILLLAETFGIQHN